MVINTQVNNEVIKIENQDLGRTQCYASILYLLHFVNINYENKLIIKILINK